MSGPGIEVEIEVGSVAQVAVAMLEPLQEGGTVTAAAAHVLEQMVVRSRQLLKQASPDHLLLFTISTFAEIC